MSENLRDVDEVLDAVLQRADEGIEFGPKSTLLLHRIVRDVRASLAPESITRDLRPHSRACGISRHERGRDCHTNCPTCGGYPIKREGGVS